MKGAATVMPDLFHIDFEPLGRRAEVSAGKTLLDAAQSAGVGLAAVCGGVGTCNECRLRLAAGTLTPLSGVELDALSPADLSAGFRLACQAEPLSDVKLDIPPESLTSAQRLQVEGQEIHVSVKPAVLTPGAYGLAVDIGTTKLAAYLVRLDTGETAAKLGAMNPQIAFGEDIISRISYAGRKPDGAKVLQQVLVETLNKLVLDLCLDAHVSPSSVLDAVLVGNTTMHHLFVGLPVEQLGHAPFAPATTQPLSIPAAQVGLNLGPGAVAYLPPVIAGYVGADHIAMLIATEAWKSQRNLIALDIGTNTEISLVTRGKVTCCSCASGPAFEGAHIREGMRAAPGAIERARWSDGEILWQTIADQPPVGICGSGILDVVAALQDGKLVKPTGVMPSVPGSGLVLVPAVQTGLGRDLLVTRKDVHEIQLAKSAIRVGVEILLKNAGLTYSDLDEFIVAGAFGTYLDLRSAVRTGMFPPLPLERFRQVGNAAGVGAKQMLVSVDKRREAEQIAGRIGYVELTSQAAFTPLFMEHLCFEV
ncbi:MAG: ASKHA domain-containing protein [Anaerolineales bacterium]